MWDCEGAEVGAVIDVAVKGSTFSGLGVPVYGVGQPEVCLPKGFQSLLDISF